MASANKSLQETTPSAVGELIIGPFAQQVDAAPIQSIWNRLHLFLRDIWVGGEHII